MIIHFAGIAFDIVVFWRALSDFEIGAGNNDIGGVGTAGPFLAIGAVAESGGLWGASVGVGDSTAEAAAFC